MKKLILVVILIGVFLAGISTGPAFSQTTTINFDTRFPNCSPDSADDLPVPPDLYRDLGVLFSAINPDGTQAYIWGVCGIPSVLDPPYEGGVFSSPNAIKGWRGSTHPVVADFVVPNTNEPGITSYVKVGVSSGPGPGILSVEPDGSPAVRLEAYDIDGNLIAVDFANPPPEYNNQFDYLEVSQPNIARVIMIVGLYRETFDDFEFSPVTPIECTGDLLFTAVQPCRIVDTRLAGGAIPPGGIRGYNVYGAVASQGGNPAGCPSPSGEPRAVALNVTAVPLGNGNIVAYPFNSPVPNASLVNYRSDAQNVANSGTVKTCFNCAKDISVKSRVGTTHVVIDVLGYYFPKP